MGLFSPRIEATPSVTQNMYGDCVPPSGCAELLKPDENTEQLLPIIRTFVACTEDWYTAIQHGKQQITVLQPKIRSAVEDAAANDPSLYVGNVSTYVDQTVGVQLVNMRLAAAKDVKRYAGLETNAHSFNDLLEREKLLSVAKKIAYLNKIVKKQLVTADNPNPSNPIGEVLLGKATYQNPYYAVFLQEVLAKLHMRQLDLILSGAATTIAHPANFSEYPEATQRFIATEFAKMGKNSYVRELLMNSNETGFNFFDYLQANGHSAKTAQFLGAFSLGVKLGTELTCPLNSYGICRSLAERAQQNLPEEVKTDIENRGVQTGKNLVQQLETESRQLAVHELWTLYGEVTSAQPNTTNYSRKRNQNRGTVVGRTAVKQLEASITPDQTTETAGPSAVIVSLREQAGVYESFNPNEPEALENILERVIASGAGSNYINHVSNKQAGLGSVRRGLQVIFASPTFRNERSITKMSNFDNVFSQADGQRMTVWRYAGKDDAVSNGRDSDKLRILFGMSGDGSTRRIEILGIEHKAVIDKRSQKSTSIWK